MAKDNDPPPPTADPAAFERVTEGNQGILGSGYKKQQQDQPVPTAPRKKK